MSGWSELASLGVTVRPFDGTPPKSPARYSPFRVGLTQTVELLATELRQLAAKRVVIELALRERDIRIDGLPRADARVSSSAVRLSFESKWGPLRYETAEYNYWQDNLRAVALSMTALRAVDRYGVSKRGEQYRGWRQIPASTGNAEDVIATYEQAVDFLAKWNGDVKRALHDTHPDHGGDATEFGLVVRAKNLVSA